MIKIKIGSAETTVENVDEQWINQQINRRRADGAVVCVQIIIRELDIDMRLSTPSCGGRGGGRRLPNHREKEIFNLWSARGLDQPEFTGGAVVAFLHQVRRLL